MSKVYIHPSTLTFIDAAVRKMPQSIILEGPVGIGFSGVVDYISKAVKVSPITVLPEKNEKIDIEAGVISVDSIRRLYDLTKTKSTSTRLIVIDYAERMGHQAQNAFLKLLEEPSPNTHFILLTHNASTFLPTIRSRAESIALRNITDEQSQQLLTEHKVFDTQKSAQLLFIAKGLPAELSRLIDDEDAFTKRAELVRDARMFLQDELYDRMVIAHKYKDSRPLALILLGDVVNMLSTNAKDDEALKKLERYITASARIKANGNVRIQLAACVV